MHGKEEKYRSSDLSCCPITLLPIRHPIIASDGRRYELKDLCNWLLNNKNISPITKEPITSVIYDIRLKEVLDELNIAERYEDYDKEEYLIMLIDKINSIYTAPWKQSAYKSIATVNFCVLFYGMYLLLEQENPQIQTSSTLIYMLFGGLIDYCMRLSSQDNYSFYSIINRPITVFSNYLTSIKKAPPSEEYQNYEEELELVM